MRNIRGVKNLNEYLEEINCPMSQATLYKLVKEKAIPHVRPAPKVLIFNLDKIDAWLNGEVS